MPRLNGVRRIADYLGVSEKAYRKLLAEGLSALIYQDPAIYHRVWADTDELDAWDRERCRTERNGGRDEAQISTQASPAGENLSDRTQERTKRLEKEIVA